MTEQQECYGIAYTMHINDICEINEVSISQINDKLKEGWVLLAIVQYGDETGCSEPAYSIGYPRAKYCTGWDNSHKSTRKHYDHKTKNWDCPVEGCAYHDQR